ncbi:MAG: hypothetical protein GY788_15745 [bacterium]|nr:hypothetical protein [bacterium]
MNTQARFGRLTLLGKSGLLVAAVLAATILAMVITYVSDAWWAVWDVGFWVVPIAWMILLLIGAIPVIRGTASLFGPGRTNGGDHLFAMSIAAIAGAMAGGGLGYEIFLHYRGEMIQCSFLGFGPYPRICTPLWELGPRLAWLGAVSGAGLVWWAGLLLLDRGHRQRESLADNATTPIRPKDPQPGR